MVSMKQSAGRRVILLLLAVWVAAAGCRRESPETGHVLFALQPAAYPGQTKSVVDEAAETKITSVLLAVYRGSFRLLDREGLEDCLG